MHSLSTAPKNRRTGRWGDRPVSRQFDIQARNTYSPTCTISPQIMRRVYSLEYPSVLSVLCARTRSSPDKQQAPHVFSRFTIVVFRGGGWHPLFWVRGGGKGGRPSWVSAIWTKVKSPVHFRSPKSDPLPSTLPSALCILMQHSEVLRRHPNAWGLRYTPRLLGLLRGTTALPRTGTRREQPRRLRLVEMH